MSYELGQYGLWTSARTLGEAEMPAAAQLAERLGFRTIWLGGSPQPDAVRPLLESTEHLVAATGIVNVWKDDPQTVASQHAKLMEDFPGRFLLGIGIGHPEATSDYTRPLKTMRDYLDGLDAATPPVPVEELCIAALGPKMLDLSRERSLGTHPYFVAPSHTRFARERLGSGKLVAPEVAVVVDTDADRAKETARTYAKLYLGLRNYTDNLLRFEFTEEDLAAGGSDRLIDAVVPQGDAEALAAAAREHVDAGADHVCLQTVGVSGVPVKEWTALASALGVSA